MSTDSNKHIGGAFSNPNSGRNSPDLEMVCPKPIRRNQPWMEALQAERDGGSNPLVDWQPNAADFGEKPWLNIDWSQIKGPGGMRSNSPPQMCGYAVGNLKLE